MFSLEYHSDELALQLRYVEHVLHVHVRSCVVCVLSRTLRDKEWFITRALVRQLRYVECILSMCVLDRQIDTKNFLLETGW